jgi:predicted transcriptional regulator
VIALPKSWQTDPWTSLDEAEQPERWDDRLPVLVLPEEPEKSTKHWAVGSRITCKSAAIHSLPVAPIWFHQCIPGSRSAHPRARRNEGAGMERPPQPEYKKLHKEFEGTLRDNLKKRFDRFAVLHRYDHQNPQQSLFSVEHLKKQGAQIPEGIEETLTNDLFVPEDFEELVLEAASENASSASCCANCRSHARQVRIASLGWAKPR